MSWISYNNPMITLHLKRVYDPVEPEDGCRILVDRLWPRGFSKEKLHADLWLKDVAPSRELVRQYHSGDLPWLEFKARYRTELELQPEAVAQLLDRAARGTVTLLYAARDPQANQAVVLAEYLRMKAGLQP